jgi:hypothetical protein
VVEALAAIGQQTSQERLTSDAAIGGDNSDTSHG